MQQMQQMQVCQRIVGLFCPCIRPVLPYGRPLLTLERAADAADAAEGRWRELCGAGRQRCSVACAYLGQHSPAAHSRIHSCC